LYDKLAGSQADRVVLGKEIGMVDVAEIAREGMSSDPEFSREMRFFTGKMKIEIGDAATVLVFEDGDLASIEDDTPDEDCKIVVRGPADLWRKMLERYPKPFFQCLQTTSVKHGLYMSTTNETFAYLPAMNRLVALMRDAAATRGAHHA
jgi:hypothetical protein